MNNPTTITHTELVNESVNLGDGDTEDIPLSFIVKSMSGVGTLTKDGSAVSVGTVIEPGEQVTWTPSTSSTDVTAFSVRAYDGDLESGITVGVQMNVFTVQLQSSGGSLTSLTDYDGLSTARSKINDGTHQGNITITLNGNESIGSSFEIEESGTGGSSNYSSLLIDVANTGSISINSGGTFTLNNSQHLRVNGLLTVTTGQSVILKNGSVIEIISGGSVSNSGTIDVNSGAFFNNKSSSNPTMTYRRNLENAEGWRYITAPTNTTLQTLLAPIWTQGDGITGVDEAFGTPNVYRWGNVTGRDRGDWIAVTDLTQTISAGEGFLVYVYADPDFDGPLTNGFPYELSVTGSEFGAGSSVTTNTEDANGWTLLGNPFGTAIDFDDLQSGANITGSVYVWTPDDTGGENETDFNSGSWATYNTTSAAVTLPAG